MKIDRAVARIGLQQSFCLFQGIFFKSGCIYSDMNHIDTHGLYLLQLMHRICNDLYMLLTLINRALYKNRHIPAKILSSIFIYVREYDYLDKTLEVFQRYKGHPV